MWHLNFMWHRWVVGGLGWMWNREYLPCNPKIHHDNKPRMLFSLWLPHCSQWYVTSIPCEVNECGGLGQTMGGYLLWWLKYKTTMTDIRRSSFGYHVAVGDMAPGVHVREMSCGGNLLTWLHRHLFPFVHAGPHSSAWYLNSVLARSSSFVHSLLPFVHCCCPLSIVGHCPPLSSFLCCWLPRRTCFSCKKRRRGKVITSVTHR